MLKIPKIPKIPANELSPIVLELLEILHIQQEMIQQLKDEIARLKGQKPKPKIKPSTLEKPCPKDETPETNNTDNKKRPGSSKRKKTKALSINETKIIKPVNIPEGSRFKGYSNYVVQDIIIKVHNTQYRIERWQTPDGNYVKLDYQVFFFTIYIMPNIAKLMFCISKMEMSQISPAPYQSYVYQTLLI